MRTAKLAILIVVGAVFAAGVGHVLSDERTPPAAAAEGTICDMGEQCGGGGCGMAAGAPSCGGCEAIAKSEDCDGDCETCDKCSEETKCNGDCETCENCPHGVKCDGDCETCENCPNGVKCDGDCATCDECPKAEAKADCSGDCETCTHKACVDEEASSEPADASKTEEPAETDKPE